MPIYRVVTHVLVEADDPESAKEREAAQGGEIVEWYAEEVE